MNICPKLTTRTTRQSNLCNQGYRCTIDPAPELREALGKHARAKFRVTAPRLRCRPSGSPGAHPFPQEQEKLLLTRLSAARSPPPAPHTSWGAAGVGCSSSRLAAPSSSHGRCCLPSRSQRYSKDILLIYQYPSFPNFTLLRQDLMLPLACSPSLPPLAARAACLRPGTLHYLPGKAGWTVRHPQQT